MNDLIVYPNCSKGGVTTVIRGRAAAQPERRIDALFFEDRGGSQAFDDLPNVRSVVMQRDRSKAALSYMARIGNYEVASVLSSPESVGHLAGLVSMLRYEFHSSDLTVVDKEIAQLDLDQVDEVTAPTQYMADHVAALLPKLHRRKVRVIPNLVDTRTFARTGAADFFDHSAEPLPVGVRPLVWVGRFDRGKGYRHFVRLLASLPEEYFGVMVVSLEDDPDRVAGFLSECAVMGVTNRVKLLLNLPQPELASLYRWSRQHRGWAVSTSLLESFGYFVAESTACGLPVAAFDLPVWREHERQSMIHTVKIGSVKDLAATILQGDDADE